MFLAVVPSHPTTVCQCPPLPSHALPPSLYRCPYLLTNFVLLSSLLRTSPFPPLLSALPLDPLFLHFFILYINDIEHVSDIIKPILFADDTSLFHSHACFNTLIQEVNIQLHKFSTWFNTNKLSLNTKKSNFIIFTPNGKKYNISEAEININGSKIKHVKCTTFLGITIDEHLDWKVHIDNLSNKIARNVGVLNKLKHFLPAYIMKTLYSTLIESHLQYCTLLWANSHVTNIRKLQLLQKKAIRIITSSHYIAHTEPLFSMTKLLKLDDLYKYQLGIFMHKVTHCQLPQNMSSMFFYEQTIYTVINSETIMHIISNK